jgi:hypothetical protein
MIGENININIDVTVKNINAVAVNGKYVIYTGNAWVRQAGSYTESELAALKDVTARLDNERAKAYKL